MSKRLSLICYLIFFMNQIAAQLYDYNLPANRNALRFSLNFTNEQLSESRFLSSNTILMYNTGSFHLISDFSINQNLQFFTPTEIRIIEKPVGVEIENLPPIQSQPNSFEISKPIEIKMWYDFSQLELGSTLRWIKQKSSEQFFNIEADQNNNYFYVSRVETANKSSLYADLFMNYRISDLLKIGIALDDLNATNFESETLLFTYQTKVKPSLLVQVSDFINLEANKDRSFVRLSSPGDFITPNTKFSLELTSNYRFYTSHLLKAGSEFRLNLNFLASLSYSQSFGKKSYSQEELQDWLKLSRPFQMNKTQTISLTLQYNFIKNDYSQNPRLLEINNLTNRIFNYKNNYYSNNPIATALFVNPTAKKQFFRVELSTSKDLAMYSTETLAINPDDTLEVPLYLFIKEPVQTDMDDLLQLSISLNNDNQILSSGTIQFLPEHVWDGNVEHLKYYIDTDQLQLSSLLEEITLKEKNLELLKSIINKIGQKTQYKDDPISSNSYDTVRKPYETLTSGRGDCEDLVVLSASVLMSFGYECSIIDIRPSDNREGHVMLLVNSGLNPNQLFNGLNELNTITKADRFGNSKLWIPIEATILDQGFDKAHQAAAGKYYDLAIVKDELGKSLFISLLGNM